MPYSRLDQNGQNVYPFSDQNGAKTQPDGSVHTYIAKGVPPPPSPPKLGYQILSLVNSVVGSRFDRRVRLKT